ncbi:glutathione peroxidase [Phenylobacterium sp.]|uniref:Glutathione peroxidase n=1 Tax=Phenylobacterium ferrooxidans TaxID=2982689 RepID=A0ABW6CHW2_9CAUL|nr:glutathione peroxidase [Phenylobacterium sp.]MDO8323947.1 glutathione peroxidase [Phenylobacterium sp.]MDP3867214.1 glutathione peroxidase [Phenylobacterium sp.]
MSIYDFSAETLEGKATPMSNYREKVVLIVNTASKCGFTPQFEGLEALYTKYKDRGFVVLGFPCNQFGAQEPGNAEEIASFCALTYDVDFPMMTKIDVNGPKTHPLFAYLKKEKKGLLGTANVKWNFTKFLVDRKGQVVERFAPTVEPKSLESAIEALL